MGFIYSYQVYMCNESKSDMTLFLFQARSFETEKIREEEKEIGRAQATIGQGWGRPRGQPG